MNTKQIRLTTTASTRENTNTTSSRDNEYTRNNNRTTVGRGVFYAVGVVSNTQHEFKIK
jgi:hypothetical protein